MNEEEINNVLNPDLKTRPRDKDHPVRSAFPPSDAHDLVAQALKENPDIAVRAIVDSLRANTPIARDLMRLINAR